LQVKFGAFFSFFYGKEGIKKGAHTALQAAKVGGAGATIASPGTITANPAWQALTHIPHAVIPAEALGRLANIISLIAKAVMGESVRMSARGARIKFLESCDLEHNFIIISMGLELLKEERRDYGKKSPWQE
jgi:hypothetical protein